MDNQKLICASSLQAKVAETVPSEGRLPNPWRRGRINLRLLTVEEAVLCGGRPRCEKSRRGCGVEGLFGKVLTFLIPANGRPSTFRQACVKVLGRREPFLCFATDIPEVGQQAGSFPKQVLMEGAQPSGLAAKGQAIICGIGF